jgi:FKBP-type peptidyl-prolyl cis-trans isomerase
VYNKNRFMDKSFLYVMLGVAIILIAILATAQNKQASQPADLLNGSTSPTPEISFNQDLTTTTIAQVTTTTYPSVAATSSAAQELEGGLKIQDVTIGTGPEVKNGSTVVINYKGTLENGTQFDSSYDRGQPFETQIGVGRVIKGWDEGVIGMKAGGKRILTIPPELGYGAQVMGNIPANSTLIFQVELLGVK